MKIILITILLLTPYATYAGATSISQSKFVIEGVEGRITSRVLEVKNESIEAQNYRFLSQDASKELSKFLDVSPKDFRLSPGEAKSIVLRFHQPESSFKDNVKLLAYSPQKESGLVVGNGVNIPVEFIVPNLKSLGVSVEIIQNSSQRMWHIIVYTMDVIALIFFVWLVRFRQNRLSVNRMRGKI